MKKEVLYDLFIGTLAFIIVLLLIIEMTMTLTPREEVLIMRIDFIIWIIFSGDYVFRFIRSQSKKQFITENKLALISIIPFKVTKLARLSNVFRVVVFFKQFKRKLNSFINTNSLNYAIYLTLITVIVGAISVSLAEKIPLGDSLWWSIVTVTTVGYGDIVPKTIIGRITASILMVIGIGFLSMLTGTIATFFLNKDSATKTYKEMTLSDIKTKLDRFDDLSEEDIKDMYKVLHALKSEELCKEN